MTKPLTAGTTERPRRPTQHGEGPVGSGGEQSAGVQPPKRRARNWRPRQLTLKRGLLEQSTCEALRDGP